MTTLSISDTSYTSTISRENVFPPRKTIRYSNPNKKTPLVQLVLLKNAISQLVPLSEPEQIRLQQQQNLEANIKSLHEVARLTDISIKYKIHPLTPAQRVQLESSARLEAEKIAYKQIKGFRQKLPENIQLALIGLFVASS